MSTSHPLGIDVGGSGIKGAPVDLEAGEFAQKRLRIDTPAVSTPEAVCEVIKEVVDHFDGGPVGVESLAASLSEERGTLEDVIEPYLIQQGFLVRTARGRMATPKAYRHLGFKPKAGTPQGLFEAGDG